MKTLPIVARTLAFASVAALLVGCKTTTQSDIAAAVPHDYRQRHPIAVREGKQTLTVFIGDRRGGLNPSQRAEVGALAPAWRRDATGGFVIEVPYGGANERAATGAAREIRAMLERDRRAAAFDRDPALSRPMIRPGSAPSASTYPKMLAETGPCGLWPEDLGPTFDRVLHREPPALESRLRLRSAISPRRSPTRPTWSSRAPRRRC